VCACVVLHHRQAGRDGGAGREIKSSGPIASREHVQMSANCAKMACALWKHARNTTSLPRMPSTFTKRLGVSSGKNFQLMSLVRHDQPLATACSTTW